MKILYDNIIFSLQKSGGISVMWAQMVKRLLNSGESASFLEYQHANKNIFRQGINIPETVVNVYKSNGLFFRRYLAPKIMVTQNTIFHSSYYRIIKQSNVANVATVHDFIYQFYRKGLAKFINTLQQRQAIKNADLIICVSNSTKNDLLRLYPGIASNKIKVIHHGISNDFYLAGTAGSEASLPFPKRSYAVYVGDRAAGYKNFAQLVKVFPAFTNLVIVGGGQPNEKEVALVKKHLGPNRYKFTGYVSNSYLNTLYNNAFALIYPSLYEGFGMPVLEAQKAGCPVIALNSSSIPEVAGSGAILLNELSGVTIANAMESLCDDPVRHRLVSEGLKNADRFSWDAAFNHTIDAYRELWKNKFAE